MRRKIRRLELAHFHSTMHQIPRQRLNSFADPAEHPRRALDAREEESNCTARSFLLMKPSSRHSRLRNTRFVHSPNRPRRQGAQVYPIPFCRFPPSRADGTGRRAPDAR